MSKPSRATRRAKQRAEPASTRTLDALSGEIPGALTSGPQAAGTPTGMSIDQQITDDIQQITDDLRAIREGLEEIRKAWIPAHRIIERVVREHPPTDLWPEPSAESE